MGLTVVEKIATRHAIGLAPGSRASAGACITVRPKHLVSDENTSTIMPMLRQMCAAAGTPMKFSDPRQAVIAINSDTQHITPEQLGKHARIESFAHEQSVDFYPVGTGACQQVMVEQGYVTPGSMVAGCESNSNLYGALCCLGATIECTDAASIWATSEMGWQVPPVAKVMLRNKLRPGVAATDVIIALCSSFNANEVLNHIIEFTGDGVASLNIDQRMSIAHTSRHWGAVAALFPFDLVLRDYLLARVDALSLEHFNQRPGIRRAGSFASYTRQDVDRWAKRRDELRADPDANYAVELELDLSSVIPHIAGPGKASSAIPLHAIEPRKISIGRAWLTSCVNAKYEDLANAATIMKSKRIDKGVEFSISAATADIQKRCERDGHWKSLLDAGAKPLAPGRTIAIARGAGVDKHPDICIPPSNSSFEGNMADCEGNVYLASPAVVAASAINGFISAPTKHDPVPLQTHRALASR